MPEGAVEARKILEAAVDQASQAITEGRDAVQGLRLSAVEKNDLSVAIRTIGEELAAGNQSSPTFEVVVKGSPRNLHPILRDEVYRITAEALRNAFRHAQARQIEVEIGYGEKEFTIHVRDDGRGIDREVLSVDGREGHFGLHGMRERAELVGGKLVVWSKVESGTEIELSIPASKAYTKSPRRFRLFHMLFQARHRCERENKVVSSEPVSIRILVVDDHPVVRQGIAVLVGTQPDMTLVAEASNGREAIQQFRAHRPDVTIMDLQMPEMSGLDALIAIRGEFPNARIIVLTTYAGDVQILRALKSGAQGYLLKNTFHKDLIDTIRAVHAGKKSLSPEVSYEIAEHSTDDALTPAEVSVLKLIAAGNANKQIADQLSITEDTVKSRVKNILSKLGAHDRTQAAMIGLKRGIINM